MKGLHGKAAIVTGAAQGIGKAIAERLTEEGVHVLWADINEQKVRHAQSATGKGIAMKVPPRSCPWPGSSWCQHVHTLSDVRPLLCR